jgi:ferredoxin-NADP reductase
MILTFKEKIQRTSDCFSFMFSTQNPVTWLAGQFMQFSIQHENPDDRGINRFFTICTAPYERDIMITTRYESEKSSTFKKALFSLEKNQSISAFQPLGEFTVGPAVVGSSGGSTGVSGGGKDYVFIAGGIGITPYRAILKDLDHKDELKNYRIRLLYSNRNQEIVFKDDFDVLANANDSFKVRYIISPEKCDIGLIKVAITDWNKKTYYISGPPGMVKSIETDLITNGIEKNNLKLDYFPGY